MKISKVFNDRYVLWIVALIFVVVLIVAVFKTRNSELVANTTPTPSATVSVSATPKASQKVTQVKTGGTANQTQAYTELVSQYAGKRFQFDINCQMIPNYSTFPNGTAVMFDNRSGDARTIVIDGKTYSFPGYGYKVLTLYSTKLPHSVSVSKCGAAVNVGSILLQ